jgi:hypothetical protein
MTTRPRPPEESLGMPQEEKKGGVKMQGNMMLYVAMVVIALVGAYVVNMFVGVSKSDFTKNIGLVSTDIAAMKTDTETNQRSIDSALASIPTTITGQISTFTKRLSDVETSTSAVKEAALNASTLATESKNASNAQTNNISALQTLVDGYKTRIATLESQAITDKSAIASLTTDLNTTKTNLNSLNTKVEALTTGTPTNPTNPTTPTTPTGISVVVSNPSLPLTFSSGYTNTVNITITNNTNKGLYGGYLTMPVQLIGTLPTGETINTVLPVTSLTSSLLTWRPITYVSPVSISVIGDFNGYISGNSSVVVTISVDAITASTGNLLLNIGAPSFSGFTSY